ncbi:Hsp70 family protein [uncultured Selenomonas sp.]|uniref:Hsp70 family protein n=1 Tax=uncultured Selenomonas sp. TaxID=159275 RepID=UPI0028F0B90E|nr:Hsp70 family protein [uncultured Selenomonas sp.]
MDKFVGIDFGACNIKMAHWRDKRVDTISLSQNAGQDYIPNVILYDMTRAGAVEQKIGDPAKDAQEPENSVEYVKRKLELETWSKPIPNLQRDVSAVDAATDIFRGLSERLQKKLNCEAHELHAVITVPVCSSGLQRSRIYQAARTAGITVEEIVTEPFAAMFAVDELFNEEERDDYVLIFDFGGSTLDLCLLHVENHGGLCIEELASAGLSYGGIDIDAAIFSEIMERKYAAEIQEIRSHDDTVDQAKTTQELRDLVTKLKERLFEEEDEEVELSCTFYGSGQHYTFELTHDEMKELFHRHDLRGKIYGLLDELFDQTYVQKDEVTRGQRFGGTARIEYVRDLLTEYFGRDIFGSEEDGDLTEKILVAVARGAAQYLHIRRERDDVEIAHKIPFSLGIARGSRFWKCIECVPHQRSPRIGISWEELSNKNFHVAVYQCFADSEQVGIDGKDGAIYVGSVTVDRAKYQAEDGVLLEMELSDRDHLRMIFSEVYGEEIREVESKVLDLSGTEE